jgi:cell division protein FtsA
MSERLVSVLDLGATKAVCLVARIDPTGGVEALAVATTASMGLDRGAVSDAEAAATSVDAVCREAESVAGAEIAGLIAGINGPHLRGDNSQGFLPLYPRTRLINRDDVLRVIDHSRRVPPAPDREQIMAIPREFRVDGQAAGQKGAPRPVGMSGSRLEVVTHLVTGDAASVQSLERAVAIAGRRVTQMVAQPIASGLGVASGEEMVLGCVVVDLGAATTSVGVFAGGAIAHLAVLPLGGSHVTSDIRKLLKTEPGEAERLKIEHALSLARAAAADEAVPVVQQGHTHARYLARTVLCEIVESRMREIAGMVRIEVERSGLYGMLPGGVILTGGGAQLGQTSALFSEVLKPMQARFATPRATGSGPGWRPDPGLAAAVGLARFELGGDDDDLQPVSGIGSWKAKIRGLRSLFAR